MTRPIGYYVHHQGAGHRARALALAAALDWPVILLGTGLGAIGVDLPDDRRGEGFDGADGAADRPEALHYAPIDHDGVRGRVARIAGWIAQARPALMVVDVSVEVAMLARLASVPIVYVRLAGDRTDPAHLDAFRGARALLAPFAAPFESAATPGWVRDRTFYAPGIAAPPASVLADPASVLMVVGRGGAPVDGNRLADAARSCPHLRWRAIGPVTAPRDRPANLELAGWSDRPERDIAGAAVVIGAAGDGLVGAVLAADRPFVCLPEPRAFGEQRAAGLHLRALGAAIVCDVWPDAAVWPALIARALALDPAARRMLADPHGTARAARWLHGMAAGDAERTAA